MKAFSILFAILVAMGCTHHVKINQSVDGFPKLDPRFKQVWSHYEKGLKLFKEKKLEEGIKSLMTCYENVNAKESPEIEEFRIQGMCLKKIGWYHRRKKDYHKAFSYHQMRLVLVKEYGSSNEIHDALISLDVDAYLLKNKHLSKRILKMSIPYGEAIKDRKNYFMALGTTYNNMSGTLHGLKKFEDSESAGKKALDYWKSYEALAGQSEMKVPWAYYTLGEAYEKWAEDLKSKKESYSKQKHLAKKHFLWAQTVANERKMPDTSKKWIDEKVKKMESL